uniref:LTD domain-containing protein n=1 Tax=Leptobrachium leishanense TaxID=445787 RepID=A0A8C5MCY9_9ANUR
MEKMYREQIQEGLSNRRSGELTTQYQHRLCDLTRKLQMKEDEVASLQLLVAQKEVDIQGLKGAVVSPSIQLDVTKQELAELQRNIHSAQEKYEEEFSQRLKLRDRVSELRQHIENLNQNHSRVTQELRIRFAQSEVVVLQLEEQLRNASRGGPTLLETVQRIQEASESEMTRMQNEMENIYNKSRLEFELRLNNDRSQLSQLKEENQYLQRQVDELSVEVTSLQKKLFSEEAENRSRIEKMEEERVHGLQHMAALEGRLQEVQDLLLVKMRDVDHIQNANLSLRSELDVLKSMLEEEEQMSSTHFQIPLPVHPLTEHPSHPLTEHPSHPLTNSFPSSVLSQVSEYTKSPLLASSETISHLNSGDSSKSLPSSPLAGEENHRASETMQRPDSAPLLNGDGRDSLTSSNENVNPKKIYKFSTSSALGNLEIADVNPNYVKIRNTSPDEEEDVGGYIIQQNICGHPVSIYRFPPKIRVMASCAVTVWAASANVPHNPPTHFLWKELNTFMAEPQCTTILSNANSHAIAWYTPVYTETAKSIKQYEVSEKRPKTSLDKLQLRMGFRNTDSDIEPVTTAEHHRTEKVPVLLRREKIPPPALQPSSSPWTQSVASPIHPDHTPNSLLAPANGGRSSCHQKRPQAARREVTAGSSRGKNHDYGKGHRSGRGPTRSAEVRKGTLNLLLPHSFLPVSDQHWAALQILQSVQNLSFQPPMPQPGARTPHSPNAL